MISVTEIDGRKLVCLGRVVALLLKQVCSKAVVVLSVQALAAGLARPPRAGVRGAGVQHCGLVLFDANTHNLEVLHFLLHKLAVNEKLPSAGFHNGPPLAVGEDAWGCLVSQAGADQRGCLVAILIQLLQDQHCLKSAEQHVHILVLFEGGDTGIAGL